MKKILTILFIICYITCFSQDVIKNAEYYLFVREITQNRSVEIDSFNTAVNVKKGSPWCASFVSYVFNNQNIINPNSAWSPNFALKPDRIWDKNIKNKIKPGDVVTFYYTNLGRVGHVGIIYKIDDKYIYTIEGNTNSGGSREGDGVYKKKRELRKVYAITRYYKIKK